MRIKNYELILYFFGGKNDEICYSSVSDNACAWIYYL